MTGGAVGVHSLGYLRLTSVDVSAWSEFAVDVLGMTASRRAPQGGAAFRMDEYAARLVVVPGKEAGVDGIGFEVADRRELDRLCESLVARGTAVREGTEEECADRQVRDLRLLRDPLGTPLELFSGPALDHEPLETRHVRGFVTGDVGMGHVVLGGEASEEALVFYQDVLGFTERNTMRSKSGDGSRTGERITFLGCNPRHHTVALMRWPEDARLIHFMVEVDGIDDVGRCLDRALARGIPQRLSLGRHSNDGMVSFYSSTPDGFTIEVGHDGRLVAPGAPTYEITATSYWGHRKATG